MSKIRPKEYCIECGNGICDWCLRTLQRREIRRIKEIEPPYCKGKINKFGWEK